MIIGQPGSGKSTLAGMLGEKSGLPIVYIDHIHWQPGWVERSKAEKTRLCHLAEAQEQWIIEGGHSQTWDNRALRADVILWLDIPVWQRLGRILWRTWRWRGRNRRDLPEGCREGFHGQTLPFWAYIWRTRKSGRKTIERLLQRFPQKPVARLTSLSDVRQLLDDWPKLNAFSQK